MAEAGAIEDAKSLVGAALGWRGWPMLRALTDGTVPPDARVLGRRLAREPVAQVDALEARAGREARDAAALGDRPAVDLLEVAREVDRAWRR